MTLSYDLRPGGNRLGPAVLWDRFDAAVHTLGVVMEGTEISAVATGFAGLSDVCKELAVAIDAEVAKLPRRAGQAPYILSFALSPMAPRADVLPLLRAARGA